jgi:hypothetical protein
MDKYILDEHGNPKLEPDLVTWATWYEENGDKRRVAFTEVGEAKVSTVFLGLDHNWSGGAPVLWETLIYGGRFSGEILRYTSRTAALVGHEIMVARATTKDAAER